MNGLPERYQFFTNAHLREFLTRVDGASPIRPNKEWQPLRRTAQWAIERIASNSDGLARS